MSKSWLSKLSQVEVESYGGEFHREARRRALADLAAEREGLGLDGWTVSHIWTKWTKEFFATPD